MNTRWRSHKERNAVPRRPIRVARYDRVFWLPCGLVRDAYTAVSDRRGRRPMAQRSSDGRALIGGKRDACRAKQCRHRRHLRLRLDSRITDLHPGIKQVAVCTVVDVSRVSRRRNSGQRLRRRIARWRRSVTGRDHFNRNVPVMHVRDKHFERCRHQAEQRQERRSPANC